MSEKRENERIKKQVLRMRANFVHEVEPKYVLDLLIQEYIVNKECRERIMNKETKQDRCRALLDFLEDCSNDKAFITLKGALQDNYPWIVKRIDTPDADDDNEDKYGEEPLKKELGEVNAKLAEAMRELGDLKGELQSTKNELKEVKRDMEILKRVREFQPLYQLCTQKRSLTSAVDNSRKKKCVGYEESPTRFESCIIMLGTFNNEEFSKDVTKINLNRRNKVSTIGQLPLSVNGEFVAAVYGNSLFVTGLGENCDKIWKFDARSSNWEYCNTMIRGRGGHSVAFVDHVLYICGGWVKDGETFNDVEAYDTINDKRTTVGKLVRAVHGSGNCLPFKSSLYIFGGCTKNKTVDYVQVYDTKLNSCILLPQRMPVARLHLRAVLWENKAILLGWQCCLIYNFDAGTWKMSDQFKADILGFCMIVHNGKLFVLGGGECTVDVNGDENWIFRDDVRSVPVANVLNNESTEWSHHARLPKPTAVYSFGKLEFPVQQFEK